MFCTSLDCTLFDKFPRQKKERKWRPNWPKRKKPDRPKRIPEARAISKESNELKTIKTLDLLDLVSFWRYFHDIEIHDLQYHCKNPVKRGEAGTESNGPVAAGRGDEGDLSWTLTWNALSTSFSFQHIFSAFSLAVGRFFSWKEIIILRPRMHLVWKFVRRHFPTKRWPMSQCLYTSDVQKGSEWYIHVKYPYHPMDL